jgi:F-type H+-transporting ATPase subunit delta
MKVVATTAIALSKTQQQAITKDLEKKYKQVTLENVVDPAVIGGISLELGSTQLDGTIRNKLAMIKKQLG